MVTVDSSVPKVSVIVPNYNHARFLRKRLDTILAQTFQDFEVILLDDCSTDDSRLILSSCASDPRVRLDFNEVNSGSTFKQWNKGVRLARCEYIWIAESDDYADEYLLERLLVVLEQDPTVVFAHSRSHRVLEDDQIDGFEDAHFSYSGLHGWNENFCIDGQQECRDYFLFMNPVPNASAVVFRKAVYQEIGGADESLILCGDWKLWAAMALTGKIAYVSQPLSYYRWHPENLRTKTAGGSGSVGVMESLQVIRWILDRVELSDTELIRVYKALAAGWVPELMRTHLPLTVKSAVLRHARAVDPHPMRRAVAPALATVRRKLSRHWRPFRRAQ